MDKKIKNNNNPRKTRSDAGKKRDIDMSFSNPQPLEVCPKCNGDGHWFLPIMGTTKVCPNCNGTGKVPSTPEVACPACGGQGKYGWPICEELQEICQNCSKDEYEKAEDRIKELEASRLDAEQDARDQAFRGVYAEITKDLNDAVILHNEIKPNGNVMVKGGFVAELQKKYVAKLRALVIPEGKE